MAALYIVIQCLQIIAMYADPNEEHYNEDQALAPYRPRVGRPFPLDQSFDVRAFSTEYCRQHYRFTCTQLEEILDVLGIRENIITYQRDNVDPLTAFCMVIYRISYPARMNRMEETFRRSAPAISRVINHFIALVIGRFDHMLSWDHRRLTRAKLAQYADACQAGSGYMCNAIIGLIDGTVRKIPEPTIGQQAMYNGHKHMHAIKYQSVVAPDGIILHISKGYPGSTHDSTIYQESGLIDSLAQHAYDPHGNPLAIYGDAAYEPDPHMIVGYRGHLNQEQEAFNKGCNGLRIIVEWAFGQVTKYFSGIDFPRSHRMLSTCVESHYRFAVLLTNIHTCYYGDQASSKLGLEPPTIREYFHVD